MAQNPHEYLIEQVQFSDNVSTSVSENSLELEFNHPCKEIFLTTQQEYFRDCCKQFEACEPLYKALGIQPFNYTDCLDAMPPAYHAFHGPDVGTDDLLSIVKLYNAGPYGAGCIQDASNSHFGTHIIHNGLFRNPGAATHLHRAADQRDLYVRFPPGSPPPLDFSERRHDGPGGCYRPGYVLVKRGLCQRVDGRGLQVRVRPHWTAP